jgi:hypothetical protein
MLGGFAQHIAGRKGHVQPDVGPHPFTLVKRDEKGNLPAYITAPRPKKK